MDVSAPKIKKFLILSQKKLFLYLGKMKFLSPKLKKLLFFFLKKKKKISERNFQSLKKQIFLIFS